MPPPITITSAIGRNLQPGRAAGRYSKTYGGRASPRRIRIRARVAAGVGDPAVPAGRRHRAVEQAAMDRRRHHRAAVRAGGDLDRHRPRAAPGAAADRAGRAGCGDRPGAPDHPRHDQPARRRRRLRVSVAVQPDRWLELLLGGLGCFLFFFVAHMVSPKGMGMGDVKMALMIGLGLGQHAFFALFAAFLASTVLSMFLLIDARPQGAQDLRAVRPVPRVRRRRRPDLGRGHLADPDRRVRARSQALTTRAPGVTLARGERSRRIPAAVRRSGRSGDRRRRCDRA